MAVLVEMRHITKAFNGVYALEDVDFTVQEGEIHALLGENGAGKTTLMNILFGIYTADSGEVRFKGEPALYTSPKEAIEHGIGMVHQHFSLVKRMTVLDNVLLGLKGKALRVDRKNAREKLVRLSSAYSLTVDPDRLVSSLSVGEQQRVEILKALYRDVSLLILDEPTGVLTPQETQSFFQVLRKLRDEGYGIIIITHRLKEIKEVSDRVTVLRDGHMVRTMLTAESSPEELSRLMIGRELKRFRREDRDVTGEGLLSLRDVSAGEKLSGISLELRKGEILGIAGVEGNGQKELAEVITGIQKASYGSILLDGDDITGKSVRERYEAGIAYISEDRQADSLVMSLTVSENLLLRDYRKAPYSKIKVLMEKAISGRAREAISGYNIKTSGKSGEKTPVRLLSGGNQQKVILARELSDSAKLIVASQPARGLDIGATEFVHSLMLSERDKGKGIVLISADLEEILALSDRIAVMYGGRIAGVLDRAEARVDQIGLLMGGVQEDGK